MRRLIPVIVAVMLACPAAASADVSTTTPFSDTSSVDQALNQLNQEYHPFTSAMQAILHRHRRCTTITVTVHYRIRGRRYSTRVQVCR